ncbi:PASTA domain-containing protein [Demequina sp. NBRC 110055]|uniref:PASTA domain-containing protein n=1 Tax=Demequina sp. NBRC 110055 TaxID=1570344 RepID=UPI0013564E71|nr:PASTA domain-containing protein [Demequina sp. NBRC 110055]
MSWRLTVVGALVVLGATGCADPGEPNPTASLTAVVATPVPDLMGMTLDEAADEIEAVTGSRPEIMMETDGVVVDQSPAPGEPIPENGTIGMEFSQ